MEEKRHFRRYRKCSEFSLLIKDKPFKAKTLDYSLTGIGAMVEDSPPIKEGDVVSLNITVPLLKTEGKIVWTKRIKSGLKIGISSNGDLRGNLEDYALADTLTGLQRTNGTGILEVVSDAICKRIYIKNGDMIFAASNRDKDRLGDILLKEKKITKEQYDQSVKEMKKTKQRQGTVLVRLGHFKPQDLAAAVTHQIEEIIISLFSLRHGSFEFKKGPLPTDEIITLKLSAANLIYRGVKRINVLNDIIGNLPPMDSILCFSTDPLKLFQNISLDIDGKTILSYIDGKTAINHIVFASNLDRLSALKTIYALLSTGIIEVVEEKTKEDEVQEAMAEDIIEEPEVKVDAELVNMIEETHSTYKDLGYYGVLGIKQYATTSEIKSAYYDVAKRFHPDRHFYLSSETLKGKLTEIFAYVTEAYTTLSSSEKRRQYDRRLSHRGAPTLSNEELAAERFAEGKIELAKSNLAQAMELFGQAAYLNSSTAKYHYHYGLALIKLNRLKEASRAVERALKIEPSNPDYLAEAGHTYLKLNLSGRAKSNLEAALKISPSHKRAAEGMENLSVKAS
ncbi:MAG: DnaJ domain-containing protein [Thermodesulfovibrionales bacterium]|nr:DnaJ domain-containing protein [Thermodesulfovibrionales bacterium]